MSTAQTTATTTAVARNAKKASRRAGKKRLVAKLRADKETAKTYFGSKAKRAADKKSAYRKKKSRKK